MNTSFRFFTNKSIYQYILPYNLNWIIKDLTPVESFLKANPLIVADVGARAVSLEEIENLRNFIIYYAFDADKEECERLKTNPPAGFKQFKVFPYFISDKPGTVEFHLYKDLGLSSHYLPDNRFKNNFGNAGMQIDRTVTVESSTLDELMEKDNLPFADIIKLDTQGTELSILQASPKNVANAFLIEAEVEFTAAYHGQALFYDVHKFMHESGFDLLYLNRVFSNRNMYDGISRGQLIFGDALFGRREDKLEGFTIDRISKYIITLINYGHKDFAYQLTQLYPDVLGYIPKINTYFQLNKYNRMTNLQKKGYYMLDKILAFLLHKRKTNRFHIDSDRSYPIR